MHHLRCCKSEALCRCSVKCSFPHSASLYWYAGSAMQMLQQHELHCLKMHLATCDVLYCSIVPYCSADQGCHSTCCECRDENLQNADSQPADEGRCSREGRSRQGTCPQDMLPAPGIIHIQPCRDIPRYAVSSHCGFAWGKQTLGSGDLMAYVVRHMLLQGCTAM